MQSTALQTAGPGRRRQMGHGQAARQPDQQSPPAQPQRTPGACGCSCGGPPSRAPWKRNRNTTTTTEL
eukprot:7424088-Lingulodinium_polyedra.AAC.1